MVVSGKKNCFQFFMETGSEIFGQETVILKPAESAGGHSVFLRASQHPLEVIGAELVTFRGLR